MPHERQRSQTIMSESKDPDDWYGVQDKKERKKIQDRLAQRSRRKRLAESKQVQQGKQQDGLEAQQDEPLYVINGDDRMVERSPSSSGISSASPMINCTMPSGAWYASGMAQNGRVPQQPQEIYIQSGPVVSASLASITNLIGNSRDPLADALSLNIPSVTIFLALHNNARLLNTQSAQAASRKQLGSMAASSSLPATLQPLPLQASISHMPYIDCIPFPILRQNLLSLQGIIDQERFCWDLVGNKNNVVSGVAAWDPRTWSFGSDFMEKWGFLFYQSST